MEKIKLITIFFINKTLFTFIIFLFIQNCFSQESWTPTSMVNVPTARYEHTAVWTGSKVIIWGGGRDWLPYNYDSSGGIFDPITNSWVATSYINVPQCRISHTAIWTGSKMIIWGGGYFNLLFNTGGLYEPSSNTWQSTSIVNAPTPRACHTAIWTGTKMIIWGGVPYINTGGIYDPMTDTWVPTSTINAALPRNFHTAIWTGSKMIIWGGVDSNDTNTGGIYDPSTNSWSATSTVNAPSPRYWHTAIWTGSKMIIWGGYNFLLSEPTNTGGIYDPQTNTWTPTSTINAPSPRHVHSAIWTGIKMIIWGGR